jgi:hypothetical protein
MSMMRRSSLRLLNSTYKGKDKDWYKRLNIALLDWQTLQIQMLAKYRVYDGKDLRVKMDAIKQEFKQRF